MVRVKLNQTAIEVAMSRQNLSQHPFRGGKARRGKVI